MKKQFIITTTVIFILLGILFTWLKGYAPEFQFPALMTGNVIMAVLSAVTYLLVDRQLNGRAQAFARAVSASSFLKLMVCMVSMLVYVLLNRANIHKPTVFILFGVYAIYTVAETLLLSKLVRDKR